LLVNQNSKLTVNDARVGAADEALLVNNGCGLRLGANNGSATGELRVDGYVDMADTGATNTFEVIGTNGTIDVAGNFYGLDCSNSTARFVMGADGVSPIQAGTGGSGEYLRINRQSTLALDFSNFTFSTNAIVLFEYLDDNLVNNATYGAFGTTNLSGGVRSLEIDYNYQGQKKVVATNFKRPPDGTLFWQR